MKGIIGFFAGVAVVSILFGVFFSCTPPILKEKIVLSADVTPAHVTNVTFYDHELQDYHTVELDPFDEEITPDLAVKMAELFLVHIYGTKVLCQRPWKIYDRGDSFLVHGTMLCAERLGDGNDALDDDIDMDGRTCRAHPDINVDGKSAYILVRMDGTVVGEEPETDMDIDGGNAYILLRKDNGQILGHAHEQ